LLFKWAEKYREMNRRTMTEGMDMKNPFSAEVAPASKALMGTLVNIENYAVSGTVAANFIAPYTNVDRIFMQVIQKKLPFGPLPVQDSIGPEFDLSVAKDKGVFMYAKEIEGVRIASDIQIYLDCYSKGGRDLKQADYLFEKVIAKRWAGND